MSSLYSGTSSYADYFSIPDDGDAINASSFNVAFEALGDRSAYLKGQTDTLNTEVNALNAAMQDGVWSVRESGGSFSQTLNVGAPDFTQAFGSPHFALAGDKFDVSFMSSAQMNCAGGSAVILDVYLQVSEDGGSTWNDMSNSHTKMSIPNAVAQYDIPFCLRASHTVVAPGNSTFRARFHATVTGSDTVALTTDWFGMHIQTRVI